MKITKSEISFFLENIREKGFFHLLSANILIQVFAFASQLFVAGILSPEDIGRIKIIQTYLSVFSVIAGMGFNASTLKICSEGRTHKENTRYFNAALLFSILSSSVIYFTILVVNYFKLLSSDTLISFLIPLGLFPLITNTIFVLFTAYFQATKEIKLYSNLTVSNKLFSIACIILFVYLWGIEGYYIAYNLSFILIILLSTISVKKMLSFTVRFNFKEMFKTHWRYAKSSLISNIISELSAYTDIIILGFLVEDMHEIGMYSFALTMTVLLRLFPSTVQQITIPYFSAFNNGKDLFIQTFKKYNLILYIVIIITLIVLLVLTPWLLNLIFQGKYDQSYIYLIFLAIGWSIRNLNYLKTGAIFGLGKIHYNAYIGMITLAFNIINYPILIFYFGVIGAAYASILGGIIFWISSEYFYKKALKETVWKK